jgi:leader peptidase (prepilin peptidase) / N-methyltransferase
MNLIICICVGVAAGILLNFLADIIPAEKRLAIPACKNCGHPFNWKNYFFSFRCPECHITPGLRYWFTILLAVVLSVLLAFFPLRPFNYWESLPLVLLLALVVLIDIEHRLVFIETSILGVILGAIYGLLLHKPLQVLLGGLVAAAAMLCLFYGGILFNKIMSRIRHQEMEEVALGFGDVVVCGYLGLIAGIQHVAGFLLLTVILSGIFAVFYVFIKLIIRKYNAFSAIPYVPFMALALLILFYLNG